MNNVNSGEAWLSSIPSPQPSPTGRGSKYPKLTLNKMEVAFVFGFIWLTFLKSKSPARR
ncbi:hypothetical protein [Alysiella filiformis]|uniref:hypothetical protein n=1 Tax=Alysiella filiformis TaxID=194196 RepID=UPI0015CA1E3F|nr:hypothetical protein [Alysiella filiformis]QMT30708.1 hypothetical protein H3L97_08140 [Alysiella filiformis]